MRGCCVKGCKYRSQRTLLWQSNISLHRFPKRSPLRAAWIEATGRTNWVPHAHDRICSFHFEKKYFTMSGRYRNGLLALAVPTLNIHQKAVIPSLNLNESNIHCFKDDIKPNTAVLNSSHRDHTYAKTEVKIKNEPVLLDSKLNFNNNITQSPGLTTLYSLDHNLHTKEPNYEMVMNKINVAQVENHPETNTVPGHPNIKLTVSRPSLPTCVPKVNLAGTAEQITTFGNLVLIVEPKESENKIFSKRTCCIGPCKSEATNADMLRNGPSFYRFPHDPGMALKWVEIVRRTRGNSFWTPTDDDVVCSKHFKPADMVNVREDRSSTLLHTAIPTKHLQSEKSNKVKKKQELETKLNPTKNQHNIFHENVGKKKEADIDSLRQHYENIIEKLNKKILSKEHTIIRQRSKLATLRKKIFREKIKTKKIEDKLVSLKANCENSD